MLLLLLPFLEDTFFQEKGKEELLFKVCTRLLQEEKKIFKDDDGKYYIKFLTVEWNLHNFFKMLLKKIFENKKHSKINIHSNVWVYRDQTYVTAF